MGKISKLSNKSMSQLFISSHDLGMEDLLPYPKKQWNLAHGLLFHHLMTAEGWAVVFHQVTESSTEKGKTV